MKMSLGWPTLLSGWAGHRATLQQHENVRELQSQLEKARSEWEAAERYFQTVSEPELVDHAIFSVEAARRKYLYLFRRLRSSQGCQTEVGADTWM